jgi:hypothetical protein
VAVDDTVVLGETTDKNTKRKSNGRNAKGACVLIAESGRNTGALFRTVEKA